jgi:nucleoside 2-deoxyribosyltransferase
LSHDTPSTVNRSMRVYLAARYSRYPEMQDYAKQLSILGTTVTSRWINGDHDINIDGTTPGEPRLRFAQEDWEDLLIADVVISFTEEPGKAGGRNRGGRHVEFGAALALGKRCIVVGHRENVFHELPAIEFYPTFGACLTELLIEQTAPWRSRRCTGEPAS